MKKRSDKEIILYSLLVLCWAIQLGVILREILNLCQVPQGINELLLPEGILRMAPKWDLFIYGVFITFALGTGAIIFKWWHQPINRWLLIGEGAVTLFMLNAIFKIIVYSNSPQLAQRVLLVLMGISLIGKIFYPEIRKWIEEIYRWLKKINWSFYGDAWWIVIIVILIYMPDLQRVAAMIYMGECFHHLDAFMVSSGYASLWGQSPSVDVFSEYGIGLPVIFSKMINAWGGFDYVSTFRVMMWFVIIYFILTYFLMRYWLKSAVIAGFAFILVFLLQMFHYGASPLIWRLPSASPLRFGLDILWLGILLLHVRSGKSRWLIASGIYSGFALYYMTSTGMCVLVTYYAYLIALILLPIFRRQWLSNSRERVIYPLCWALPLVSAAFFLFMTIGKQVYQERFWHNLLSFMFIFGHAGAAPFYENLKYRYFGFFIMSLLVPFTYLATLLYISYGLYVDKVKKEWIFTALLCIYGLTNYQYFVVRSLYTSYFTNALPFVMIICFWFSKALEFISISWQRRLKALVVIVSFYALWTNQNFLAYPNLVNFSRNPMTDNLVIQRFPDRTGFFNGGFKFVEEKDKLPVNDLGATDEDMRTEDDFKSDADLVRYYQVHFNFPEDVDLIKQLTTPQERVALISSFETKMLIQAKRAPFFYHFPLVESRPMTFRTFPWGLASTPAYLSDTMDQLTMGHPKYIFMEKVFLEDKIPASYQEKNSALLTIIAYVREHYQVYRQGKYLVAMKCRDF